MQKELAKVAHAELLIESHGILSTDIRLDYGGAGQNVPGYNLEGPKGGAFLKRLIEVFGVGRLSEVKGRYIFALLEDRMVVGLEQLPQEGDDRLVFAELMDD